MKNGTDKDLAWDSQGAIFLSWIVRDNHGNTIEPASSSDRAPEALEANIKRFRTVKAGESLAVDVDLTAGVGTFVYGWSTEATPDGEDFHVPFEYEEFEQYSFSKDVSAIRVQAIYSFGSMDGLDDYFGFPVTKLPWIDKWTGCSVDIAVKDDSVLPFLRSRSGSER